MTNVIVKITFAFIVGIWLAGFYHWPVYHLYLAFVVVLIYAVMQLGREKKEQTAWLIALLFFIAGMVRYIHTSTVSCQDVSNYIDQRVYISGVVSEVYAASPVDEITSIYKYLLLPNKVRLNGNAEYPVDGGILLTVRHKGSVAPAAYNDAIAVTGRIIALHGYNNPGLIDTVTSMKLQGISARMSVTADQLKVLTPGEKSDLKYFLAELRAMFRRNMNKVMPDSQAAILSGMLFGGYTGIRKDIVNDFATTGLIHILSVSGAHIALVAGLVLVIGKKLKFNSKLTSILAVGAIVFYSLLSGFTAPVVRSAIMGTITLIALGLGREKDAPVTISLAALAMLGYQPQLIYDISFQLSFCSTAGLIFLYPKTVQHLSFLPAFIAAALTVTLTAQLAAFPFIAWYFKSFSLSSFLANILVLPPVEMTVILGLLGNLAFPIIPVVGQILLVICSMLISIVVYLTSLLASLPGAKLYVPPVGIIGGAMYYILLMWLYGFVPGKNILSPNVFKKKNLLPVVLLSVFLVYITVALAANWSKELSVHFIDVGQGDAALLVTPNRRAILIDTGGGLGDPSRFDVGERIVVPYLKHYGIMGLDYLILTHGHQDHAGGAAAVAASVPIKTIFLPREAHSPAVQSLLKNLPQSQIIPIYDWHKVCIDEVCFSFIYAPANERNTPGNEFSCVIRVDYGQHSFLFTGDVDGRAEKEIAAKGIRPCTVLKVSHHGAKTSSTLEFLKAVSPQYAVISVGYNNRFGHPHPDVIQRILAFTTNIYRTDQHGAIVFKSNGSALSVDSFIQKQYKQAGNL